MNVVVSVIFYAEKELMVVGANQNNNATNAVT